MMIIMIVCIASSFCFLFSDTHSNLGDQVLSTLLYTYPFFTTGHKLLDILLDKISDGDWDRQHRFYCILSKWLNAQYSWEIDSDKTLLRSIERLIKGRIVEEDQKIAAELERDLLRVSTECVLCTRHPTFHVLIQN